MATKGFFIGEAIKFGWQILKKNLWFFIVLLILAFVTQSIPAILQGFAEPAVMQSPPGQNVVVQHKSLSFILGIIHYIISLIISVGLIKVSLNFVDHGKAKWRELYTSFPRIWSYFIASLLYGLLIIAGLILLVFPAFIWGARYGLFPYFVVDKKAGPIEALKMSAQTTMGAKWDLVGFYCVTVLLNLLGLFCIIIGLFATIPTILVAQAYVYRKLLAQTPQLASTVALRASNQAIIQGSGDKE